MFDADEEMAIASGEMMAARTLTDEELREPIASLSTRPAERIASEAKVAEAVRRMKTAKIGSLAVVDPTGRLVGIVTERDLLTKVLLEPLDLETTPVSSIMTADPETLMPEDGIVYAMNKMHVGGFRHVPIVDADGRPLYVLSIRDVVAYVLDAFESTIVNLPPDAYRHLRRYA